MAVMMKGVDVCRELLPIFFFYMCNGIIRSLAALRQSSYTTFPVWSHQIILNPKGATLNSICRGLVSMFIKLIELVLLRAVSLCCMLIQCW